jgi:hypothetical protein
MQPQGEITMTITPKDILLLAAERIQNGQDQYACIAIVSAYRKLVHINNRTRATEAVYALAEQKFVEMHKPALSSTDDSWFGTYFVPENQQRRYDALMLTANTFE